MNRPWTRRAVAQEQGVALCDLHRAVSLRPAVERPNYFTGDGIHLSDAGGRLVGDLLAGCLERAWLLDRITGGGE